MIHETVETVLLHAESVAVTEKCLGRGRAVFISKFMRCTHVRSRIYFEAKFTQNVKHNILLLVKDSQLLDRRR